MPLAEQEIHLDTHVAGLTKTPLRATHLPTGILVLAKPGETKRALLNRLEAKVRAYADELVQQHLQDHGAEILEKVTGEKLTSEEVNQIIHRPN